MHQLSWQASRRRWRSNYATRIVEGGKPVAGAAKIAVLVHYSTDKKFADYFIYLLRSLDRAGFTTIVVSSAPKLAEEGIEAIRPWCGRIIRRRNIGYDFGAWRDAISLTPEIGAAEQLLILNDSIFGPLQDLGKVFEACRFDQADVWGLTDNFDRKYHLQSFFILFGRKAILSDAFSGFWRRLRYVGSKSVVIERYEVGLSQSLIKGGLKLRALYPYRRLSLAVLDRVMSFQDAEAPKSHPHTEAYFNRLLEVVNQGHPLNPTHFFWEHLIRDLRFPFIKRELLEKNPAKIPLLVNWQSAIEAASDYPVELIEEYLQVAARNRVF